MLLEGPRNALESTRINFRSVPTTNYLKERSDAEIQFFLSNSTRDENFRDSAARRGKIRATEKRRPSSHVIDEVLEEPNLLQLLAQ